MFEANELPRIPPSTNQNQPLKATLNIKITSIQLFDKKNRQVIVKLKFWGMKTEYYLGINDDVTFGVSTNNEVLKEYLRDMKILPFQLIDDRNREQIGNGLLNWQIYIQQTNKECPFLNNQMQVFLPIVNARKKSVGQILFMLSYEKKKIKESYEPDSNQEIEPLIQNQITQPMILQKKHSKAKISKKKSVITEDPYSKPTTNFEISEQIIKKKVRTPKIYEKSNFQSQAKTLNKTKHQVQMAQLKLEAYEFFKEPLSNNTNTVYEIIEIIKLKLKKKGQYAEFLDVFVYENDNTKHYRLYPSSQKSNQFNGILSIQSDSNVQIKCSNDIGNIRFYAKDIKRQKELQVMKKNQCIGSIIIRKEAKLQNTLAPIRDNEEKEKQTPKHDSITKQQIIERFRQKQRQKDNEPAYLLISMRYVDLNLRNYKLCVKNYVWERPYTNFHIIPISELGKLFALQIRNEENQTLNSKILSSYSDVPIVKQSLRCLILHDNKIRFHEHGSLLLNIQLGNIKQVNQTINKMKQMQRQQEMREQKRSEKVITQSKEDNESEKFRNIEIEKKIYTESNPRIDTQPISEYKIQDQQPEESNQVYLVQILSRFLHNLKINLLPTNTIPNTKIQFEQVISKVTDKQNLQLVDIISDIFVVDNDKINYEQFLKCAKSYHNFLELWWNIRLNLLHQVIKAQPQCEKKIQAESQLGTISRSALWKRALPKTPFQLRNKVQKCYNLTDMAPFQTRIILQDLGKARSQSQKITIQAEPQLISDLGKLVKETVQGIVQQSISIKYQQVNIKVLRQIMQEMGIKLSHWQSLIIIEEIKGWYGVDMDLGQGIISSITVETWLKSIVHKKNKNKQRQEKNKNIVQVNHINTNINVDVDVNEVFEQRMQKLITQPVRTFQNKSIRPSIVENKSVAKSQLNEDQIFNIANLLRDNDNFRMHTIQSQQNKQNKQNKHQNILFQNILDIDNSLQVAQSQLRQKQKQNENVIANVNVNVNTNVNPNKFIKITVKQMKLKQQYQLLSPFKFQLSLISNHIHYYYIKQLPQISQKIIVQELKQSWNRQSKGIQVKIHTLNERHKHVIYGILPVDEIAQTKTTKTKTIILYEGKNIIGKTIISFQICAEKPNIFYSDKVNNVKFMLSFPQTTTTNENIHNQIKVKVPKNSNNNQDQDSAYCVVKQKQQTQIQLPADYYKQQLKVIVQGVGSCIVPLQQLYFNNTISGTFPLVSDTEHYFVCNAFVTICQSNNTNILNEAVNNNLNAVNIQQIPKYQVHKQTLPNAKTRLVILDKISSMYVGNGNRNKTIVGHIYVLNAVTNNIIYKSNTWIQHQVNKNSRWNIQGIQQYFQKQYLTLQSNTSIIIYVEYEGRQIGRTNTITINNTQQHIVKLQNRKQQQTMIHIELRTVVLPQQILKYNLDRIISVLNNKVVCSEAQVIRQQLQEGKIKEIKDKYKLTVTQIRLLKQIITQNGLDNIAIIKQHHKTTQKQKNKLLQQLIYNDTSKKGSLPREVLRQILKQILNDTSVINKYQHEQLDYAIVLHQLDKNQQPAEEQGPDAYFKVDRLYEQIKKKYKI